MRKKHTPRTSAETRLLLVTLCAVLATGSTKRLASQSAPEAPKPARTAPAKTVDPDADYESELPRIPPRDAAGSLETFLVFAGFRIEQVATEPLIADPVAISFDARGRMFVVCMRGYSEQPDDLLGQVRRLDDTDGDGVFDQSTLFVDGLSWPTGVFSYDGGVFVAAAPHILYLKDTDGDGVADSRRVVLSGFGRSNVQGLLNSLQWGLDNRIHGATSSSGGTVRSSADGARAVELRGRDFAFDPRSGEVEATSGGGQHGLSFDDWGRKFVCSNSRHIEMVMFEDRYLRRNRYLAVPSARQLIAADGGQAEVYRLSPVEPWRLVRTRLRVAGSVPGPVEGGGRAAGYFTGATGVTIYRGDAWPREYLGQAFIGDVGSNIVHRKVLRPDGAGWRAERVDDAKEFLASTEIWFRPVQLANAPDGALYVIDMYREVIEHPASLPPMIKKHLDLTSGRDRGRIYRIVPADFEQPAPVRLDLLATRELVAVLEHSNAWHRETAARLLYTRQDRAAVEPLERLARDSRSPLGRMHALYALDGLAALSEDAVRHALGDRHARVREHAVRLAERHAHASAEIRALVYDLAGDRDLGVRYQLAFTLGEFSGQGRNRALAEILARAASDRWMRLAVLSSLAEGAAEVLAILATDEAFRASTGADEVLGSLARQIGRRGRQDALATTLKIVESLAQSDARAADLVVRELSDGLRQSGHPLEEALQSGSGTAARVLRQLLEDARTVAADPRCSPGLREDAIRMLGLSSFERERLRLARLLAHREPREVQLAALVALSRFSAPEVAAEILAVWPGFSPAVRAQALEVLFARPERLRAVLDAVESGRLAARDLDPGRLRLLRSHSDPEIRRRAADALAAVELPRRQDVVARYRDALALQGDPVRGKAVFAKVCASCHEVEGVGRELGPSLPAMRNRGAEAILLGILDPNREVNPAYLNYVAVTRDGRSITGIIASETAASVTLRRADGHGDTILRVELAALRSTGLSLMPEDLEKEIDLQAMSDLISYILIAP